MTRPKIFGDHQLRECAAKGLSGIETAEELGVSRQVVFNRARALGVTFSKHGRTPRMDLLTPEQRADVETLIKRGGYTQDEAIRVVTRPKVKIRGAA